jgi:hypothetical protein
VESLQAFTPMFLNINHGSLKVSLSLVDCFFFLVNGHQQPSVAAEKLFVCLSVFTFAFVFRLFENFLGPSLCSQHSVIKISITKVLLIVVRITTVCVTLIFEHHLCFSEEVLF